MKTRCRWWKDEEERYVLVEPQKAEAWWWSHEEERVYGWSQKDRTNICTSW